MNWIEYLKIPYKPLGRSKEGADCYGFFLIIQKEIYGKDFDDLFYTNIQSRNDAIELQKKKYKFEKIEKPVEGCAVVMYNRGIPSHIGTYIGDGKIIHTKLGTGAIIEEIKNCDVEGYYESLFV